MPGQSETWRWLTWGKLPQDELCDGFYMSGLREHVHRLYCLHMIGIREHLQIPRHGRGVAAHIDDTICFQLLELPDHIRMHSRTRWISDDAVGLPRLLKQFIVEGILHIAFKEFYIFDPVGTGIGARIANGYI